MPEKNDERQLPRGFWSGTITFGLVSVPVSLFVATRPGRISLRMVDESGALLSRVYFCSSEERPLGRDEIVRGYEVEKDRFVVVEDDELDAIAPEKSQEINLERFVELTSIDPVYFERAYFLAPGRGGARPYRLLARVMEDSGRAGIATFVMRGKEYLVAIISEQGILRAETMRFHDELRTADEVGLPSVGKADKARLRKIEKVLRKLHAEELDHNALSDRRADRLEALVQKKLDRNKDVVAAPEEAEPGERESAEIIDLMQVLKRSLKEDNRQPSRQNGNSGKRRGPARAPRSAKKRGNLGNRSRDQLYEQASSMNIAGRSRMTKNELIAAIRDAG